MEPLPAAAPRPAGSPARIADVAALAGVGVATVSRVLNGHVGVRPSTRERVVEAIEALNYRPSSLARSLSLGKVNDSEWKASFSFQELDAGVVTLAGEMDGHKTSARLTRFDESTFLLTSRGFHWIQEFPFNR